MSDKILDKNIKLIAQKHGVEESLVKELWDFQSRQVGKFLSSIPVDETPDKIKMTWIGSFKFKKTQYDKSNEIKKLKQESSIKD